MEDVYTVLAFIVGIISGWSLKLIYDRSSNKVTQKNNTAGGDIAGRDVNK